MEDKKKGRGKHGKQGRTPYSDRSKIKKGKSVAMSQDEWDWVGRNGNYAAYLRGLVQADIEQSQPKI